MTFYDPVESTFYARCVESLLTSTQLRRYLAQGVVELGAGSGLPVIEAVRRAESTVRVRGFERDPVACDTARRLVDLKGPATYTVTCGDFFTHTATAVERCAIANPPYLPGCPPAASADGVAAPSDGPSLCGGQHGAEITCRVLAGRFDLVMMMVASIADPLGVLAEAAAHGYRLLDWTTRPIRFGQFCREPTVWRRIQEMTAAGEAFHSADEYLLAGVTWLRDPGADLPGADPAVLARLLAAGNAEAAA